MDNMIKDTIKNFSPIYIYEEQYDELLSTCESYPFLYSKDGICILSKKQVSKATRTMPAVYSYSIQPVASYVFIAARIINIDTGEVRLAIELDNGKRIIRKEFDRTILSKIEIKQLLFYGVKFLETSSDMLLQFLLRKESDAETRLIHTTLGWSSWEELPMFKGFHALLPTTSDAKMKCVYNGTMDIEPRGKLNTWLKLVRDEVIGNIPLTFCMLLGFASPIWAYLTGKNDLGTLVFCLSNQSSKGKSTAAMLATSVFSSPSLNNGTLRSFNATQNFLVTFMAQISGLLVALDEGAAYAGDFHRLMYLLSSGVEKSKLDGNCGMREDKSWRSIIITTSEFDLVSEDTAPNGLKARCFRITDALTTSAENADKIKTTIVENYGVVGETFVQWVLDNKVDSLDEDYIVYKQLLYSAFLNNNMQSSTLTKRIFSKLAVILQAADYVEECFDFHIDIDVLMTYLLLIEQDASATTDLAMNALDIVLQELCKNSSRILTPDRPYAQNAIAKITEDKEEKTISILKSEFQSICRKNKIQNSNQILRQLKKKAILQCEADRLTRRVRLAEDMPVQTCYVLKIQDSQCNRDYISSIRVDANNRLKDNDADSYDEIDFD